ncbi:hypothetical protein GCK72_012995 [Caenorhabditis remanei]|uniref:Uncharacterized protein n=1 Tax=Caenorhabditis remanei TaxID=31234 RepID=A0A6A5GQ83_CAERE|nr:hypothetical protein GCK72_012995 [Caenorhabditis remanei]KAF1756542.1 hypothetical protein GCK72_012995 [Caenorhabditis remanei]
MRSLLSVFILVLIVSCCTIANARRINVIVKKTNGWHDSATIQSVDYEKLGRKSWDELTEVERYLLETEHALRGVNSDSVSENDDYQEGEYDEIGHDSKEKDNDEATDSEENSIEDSDEDDEENSVSDEDDEEGKEIKEDNDDGSNGNQSKEEDDENEDSVENNSENSDEDESSKIDESFPEEDVLQEPSETSHHYNHRRIGGRAARVWNTRQYQYYHLSVHYLINVYVKLRSKIVI